MTQNNSKDKPYYTQRNNRLKPNGACNVTAMIAALCAAGWAVEQLATEQYAQPEDALMHFILADSRVDAYWKKVDPAGHYAPNEWHPVLIPLGQVKRRGFGISQTFTIFLPSSLARQP